MNQKIRINTRKLLLEKLGVRSDLLLVTEKLYLNIILMIIENKDFLNQPSASGNKYRYKFFKNLTTPLKISDEYSIEKITLDFELTKINQQMDHSGKNLVYFGMGVLTGTRVDKGDEKSPLVFPKHTSRELKMSLRLGTFDSIENITKSSFLKDFKELKREFLATLAHELKHVYDASIRDVKMKDKVEYIATTNTFRESDFRSIALLFYYAYKAHYFETEVYQTEMAKNIQAARITKKDFAEFLKVTEVYQDAVRMENFTYSDVVDPLLKIVEDIHNELFPNGFESLTKRLQGDMTGISPRTEHNLVTLAKSMEIDMNKMNKAEYVKLISLLFNIKRNFGTTSSHEDVALRMVLGGFRSAIENYYMFASMFIDEFVRDKVRKSSNSRVRPLRQKLFKHRDDLVNKVVKEFNIDDGPEGLKKSIKKMVAEINQAGADIKKKFGKLYAYDELFVDGDQPTKRTTKLPG